MTTCNTILKRNSQIALKLESTEGVPETLSAADATMLASDPQFSAEIVRYTRNPSRGVMSRIPATIGKKTGKISWYVDLAGSGSAHTEASWFDAITACGMKVDPTTAGFDITPDSTCPPSATVELRQDGVVYRIFGARGSWKLEGDSQNGAPMKLMFEFTGVYDDVEDGALFTTPTYESVIPPAFVGVTFSLGSDDYEDAGVFSKFSLDSGNTLTLRESATAPEGVFAAFIGDRAVTGSFDPEMTLVGTIDYFGKLTNGTTGALSCQVGSDAGNTIVITGPTVQISNVKLSDRGGIVVAGCDLEFVTSSVLSAGDDEIRLSVH